jgi:hypothetical protein
MASAIESVASRFGVSIVLLLGENRRAAVQTTV